MLGNSKVTITATNVNQALTSNLYQKKLTIVRAHEDNAEKIYYGSNDINSDNSDYFSPGEVKIFPCVNLHEIYLRGTQDDVLYYNFF